jgi:thioredoxin-related protein
MKRIIPVLAIVAILSTVLLMNASADPDPAEVQWKSISEALVEGPQSNRLIVLDLYTDWCGWCKRMDRDTYANADVAAYLSEHYVASKMNPEKEGTLEYDGRSFSQAEFGQALGVRGYPSTAFFDKEGKVLTVVAGYIGPDEFLSILKYFGEDIYKTTSWEDYQNRES